MTAEKIKHYEEELKRLENDHCGAIDGLGFEDECTKAAEKAFHAVVEMIKEIMKEATE